MSTFEKDARKRQAVKPDYIEALGIATWSFASLEWQVVHCCEKIAPGSLRKIVDSEKTAGLIAKHFIDVLRNMKRSSQRAELQALASQFSDLVVLRNSIIHGKPCTGPNGESRLSGNHVLEIPELENAADSFATCGQKLNSIYYGFLSTYIPH